MNTNSIRSGLVAMVLAGGLCAGPLSIVDDRVAEYAAIQSNYVDEIDQELTLEADRIDADVIEVFGTPSESDEDGSGQD